MVGLENSYVDSKALGQTIKTTQKDGLYLFDMRIRNYQAFNWLVGVWSEPRFAHTQAQRCTVRARAYVMSTCVLRLSPDVEMAVLLHLSTTVGPGSGALHCDYGCGLSDGAELGRKEVTRGPRRNRRDCGVKGGPELSCLTSSCVLLIQASHPPPPASAHF